MVTALLMFTYCFYFGEIQGLLHRWTRGRMGKPQFSLLPKSLQEVESAVVDGSQRKSKRDRRLLQEKETPLLKGPKGAPPPGHVSVTCVTEHVTQKKSLEVADCETFTDARGVLWDAFGHLLNGVRDRDIVVLCCVSTRGEPSTGDWMVLTEKSDIVQALACPIWKIAEKKCVIVDDVPFEVAFAPKKRKDEDQPMAAVVDGLNAHDPPQSRDAGAEPDDAVAIHDEVSTSGQAEEQAKDGEPESDEPAEPLVPVSSWGPAVVGWCDDPPVAEQAEDPADLIGLRVMNAGLEELAALRAARSAAESEPAPEVPLCPGLAALPAAGSALVGKHVQIHGLLSKADLNGRVGTATAFDKAKGRIRVRLDPLPNSEAPATLMAFRPENVRQQSISES